MTWCSSDCDGSLQRLEWSLEQPAAPRRNFGPSERCHAARTRAVSALAIETLQIINNIYSACDCAPAQPSYRCVAPAPTAYRGSKSPAAVRIGATTPQFLRLELGRRRSPLCSSPQPRDLQHA
jgi:hypothetical protein